MRSTAPPRSARGMRDRRRARRCRGAPAYRAAGRRSRTPPAAWGARRPFAPARARVHFGHGSDNARDEAAALVLYAIGARDRGGADLLRRRVHRRAQARAAELVRRRIEERVPAAYLTGVTWFAGLEIRVDARVLVPR